MKQNLWPTNQLCFLKQHLKFWTRYSTLCRIMILLAFVSTPASAYDTATLEQAKEFGLAISAGAHHTCAIDQDGVKCWGANGDGQLNVPALNHPVQVSAGGRHTCALDDSGVKCWGFNGFDQLNVPALNHPRQIFAGGNHTCAADGDGVKCWGFNEYGQLNFLESKHPTQISMGNTRNCVLDESGLNCRGDFQDFIAPELHNPRQIAVGEYHICALDDHGVECWGGIRDGKLNVPALQNPTQIFAGLTHTCALDDSGVKCWGEKKDGQSNVPALRHPKQVAAGYAHTCAIVDSGVKCWGSNQIGQLNIPELNPYSVGFNLFILEKSYKILSQHVYRDKKIIFENLSNTVAKFSLDKQERPFTVSQESLARLFSLYAVDPLLQETHSDFVETKVVPQFTTDKNVWSTKHGIATIRDIELSEDILDVSFTILESGLLATKSYLSGPQQHEIEDLMVAIALAKAKGPTNFRDSALQLISGLDQHQELLTTLLQNERTIGFGKMILEIQNYLRTVR